MEENLNNEDGQDEGNEEYYFSSKNPLTKYCFAFMEYIKNVEPEIYEKAVEYASDLSGITITDFDIEEMDDEGEIEDENDLEDIFGEEDDFYDEDNQRD
jgi:hypothetical protein